MNEGEPMLRWFSFEHLPPNLRAISAVFKHTADHVVAQTAPSSERTAALMQLLLAKDAAVRAAILTTETKPKETHITPREG